MIDPIKINKFGGMYNIEDSGGPLENPQVILNADVTDTGRIVKRKGRTLFVSLNEPHSLSSNKNGMWCVSNNTIYRIDSGGANSIGNIINNQKLYTVDVAGTVYASCKSWNGIIDLESNSIQPWGIDLPSMPIVTVTSSGGLTEGVYKVLFTKVRNFNVGGSGMINQIVVPSNGKISISNRNSDELVWCTEANGAKFFFYGYVDSISTPPISLEPLPTFNYGLPPYMINLVYAFGRLWGSVGNKVYYSMEYRPDLFNTNLNVFTLDSNVTMIAKTPMGLYIGTENVTTFYSGSDPSLMETKIVHNFECVGLICYYDRLENIGSNVPIWLSSGEIVAGGIDGQVISLTENKVKFSAGTEVAGLFHRPNGISQIMTCMKKGNSGTAFGMEDSTTVEVIRNGKVI